MRFSCILLFLFLLVAISGVDSQADGHPSGIEPGAQDAKATVHLYRDLSFGGGALEPSIYCDEVELARLDNGRPFSVKLDPGKHSFRSNDKQGRIELDTKAGQEYDVRVEIVAGFFKGKGRVVHMTSEQGAAEIKSLTPLDAAKVKDRTRVVQVESPASN
jgi:hypothetical protein